MKCSEIVELYLKSLREELSPDETSLLEQHLSTCYECRNALEWDKEIIAAFRSTEPVSPPEDYISEICRQLPLPKLTREPYYVNFISFSTAVTSTVAASLVLWFTSLKDVLPGFMRTSLIYFINATSDLVSFFSSNSTGNFL